jgi:hypothetical protein
MEFASFGMGLITTSGVHKPDDIAHAAVKRPCSPVMADFIWLLRSIVRHGPPNNGVGGPITLKNLKLHPFLASLHETTHKKGGRWKAVEVRPS